MDRPPIADALEAHVRGFFADRETKRLPVGARTRERLPCLRVLEVSPGRPGELWTYVSIGAWELVPESDDPRMEFVLHSPEASERAAFVVEMAAYYHANPDSTYRLGHGHTVPIGEPWLGTSNCTHLLVSKPYPLGPTFEVFDEQGVHVHFYWLLPITEAERAFKVAEGLEALEQRFDDARLEYWKVDRASVIAQAEAQSG